MPVPRPAYGRKPGPSVTPPDPRAQRAAAKVTADLAQRAVRDGAVATVILTSTIAAS
jgi:hypothetical protein